MANNNRRKNLSLAQQLIILNTRYGVAGRFISPSEIEWVKEITPLPLSDTYKIKIRYHLGHNPKTYIISPQPLTLADGADRLPHTYDTDKQLLCLYKPSYNEWLPSMPIADTIVHWAMVWMVNYENWVLTGKWLGGGHGNWDSSFSDKPKQKPNRNRIAL